MAQNVLEMLQSFLKKDAKITATGGGTGSSQASAATTSAPMAPRVPRRATAGMLDKDPHTYHVYGTEY